MLDRKRFSEIQIIAEASGLNADFGVSFETENPDSAAAVSGSTALTAGQGRSFRLRTGGQRGHGAAVTITPTEGRPKIKSLKLTATGANRSTTTQS
jgi:hypothetical protein